MDWFATIEGRVFKFYKRLGVMKEAPIRLDKDGYGLVTINKKTYRVHRLIWTFFNGPIPNGLQINHKDGDKLNNNLANLELMTYQENLDHAILTGLRIVRYGTDLSWGKFSTEDKQDIKDWYKVGYLQSEIAKAYNVTQSGISYVIRN